MEQLARAVETLEASDGIEKEAYLLDLLALDELERTYGRKGEGR